jgi:hypothetical protein
MFLRFELSMPGRNSWNRQWSGDGIPYQAVRQIGTSKAAKEKAEALCSEKFFRYRWDDGWEALVKVQSVDAREARQIRRHTDFCGYDWMVDSIIEHGEIGTEKDRAKLLEVSR